MPSITTNSPLRYQQHKKHRRTLQGAVYQGMRAEHPDVWIPVMHLMWPERLPKVVWNQLTHAERRQWRHYRELGRYQRLLDAYPVTDAHQAVNRLNRLGEITGALHEEAVTALLALLRHQALPGRLTVSYQAFGITGPSTTEPAQLITRETLTDPASWAAFEPVLRRGLALGLTYGGSVIARWPVGLRATDASAAPRWRKAGIGLIAGGQWRHLSAQEMAQADAGGPGDAEPGLSYGTLAPPSAPKVLAFPPRLRPVQ